MSHKENKGIEYVVRSISPLFDSNDIVTIEVTEEELSRRVERYGEQVRREEINSKLDLMLRITDALSLYDHKTVASGKAVLNKINLILKGEGSKLKEDI